MWSTFPAIFSPLFSYRTFCSSQDTINLHPFPDLGLKSNAHPSDEHLDKRQCRNHISQQYFGLLMKLPPELIISIADQLEDGHQALLSITCRALFRLLRNRFDLKLRDVCFDRRIRILRLLELDFPQYLTCRECGRMFKWRRQLPYTPYCSGRHVDLHGVPFAAKCIGDAYSDRTIRASRTIIDLLIRTQNPRFRDTGISSTVQPSILEAESRYLSGVSQRTQACFVKGQLFLSSYWYMTMKDSYQDTVDAILLDKSLCLHHRWDRPSPVQHMVDQFVSGLSTYREIELMKCKFCRTDTKLYIRRLSASRVYVGLEVWRNFGNGDEDDLVAAQMFDYNPTYEINAEILSRRNLQSDFEAGLAATRSSVDE